MRTPTSAPGSPPRSAAGSTRAPRRATRRSSRTTSTATPASKNLLTASHAQEYIKLLSAHAHGKNLAIAQKNTPELAGDRVANGLDFAVTEECGEYEECADYAGPFDNRVVDIEYTASGMSKGCPEWKSKISMVRRDLYVVPQGTSGYVRKTC